jgi:hypothetical protein
MSDLKVTMKLHSTCPTLSPYLFQTYRKGCIKRV